MKKIFLLLPALIFVFLFQSCTESNAEVDALKKENSILKSNLAIKEVQQDSLQSILNYFKQRADKLSDSIDSISMVANIRIEAQQYELDSLISVVNSNDTNVKSIYRAFNNAIVVNFDSLDARVQRNKNKLLIK